jgi:DNA modification methylase
MLDSIANDPLIASLRDVERRNGAEFWSFQGSGIRRGAHALLHYPAMMVPDLQRAILASILESSPETRTVLDPFVGSGTVLVESMQLGLDFCGVDINPLAGLACLAKAGPYYVAAFDEKRCALVSRVRADMREHIPRDFGGRDKWFSIETAKALEKIHYHIRTEPSLWARRLFWLALCRVVRTTSNSRMSTYKLHKRSAEDKSIEADPIANFSKALKVFSTNLHYQRDIFANSGFLRNGRYQGELEIQISDNSILSTPNFGERSFDVVMTSPPYGDNRTTIPYGQFAYLPLHWIHLEDIQPNMDEMLLANTHATDSASLGGSLRSTKAKVEKLADTFPHARQFIDTIHGNESGIKRFGSFFYDFMKSVERISARTSTNGYHVWTTGNRRIGGHIVPMDDLLAEILASRGIDVLGKIRREIHSKKMAKRNSSTDTMTAETIVLAKKRQAT